ncbi:MAG: energy transducer TonB [Rhodothalassiaceae bacterium]
MFVRTVLVAAAFAAASLLGTMESAEAAGKADWMRSIARTIASKQVYPRSALAKQIEGSAKVRVTVDRNGKIASFEVVKATGFAVLDKEINRLMRRIDPLPKPPGDVGDTELTFVVPLTWALQ